MDIRELYALGFCRFLSVTRLLNYPVPRDFKLFAIQTVSLAVTIWRRSASGKISGFFLPNHPFLTVLRYLERK